MHSLKTSLSPENWCLEDQIFFRDCPFLGDMSIFGAGGYTVYQTSIYLWIKIAIQLHSYFDMKTPGWFAEVAVWWSSD